LDALRLKPVNAHQIDRFYAAHPQNFAVFIPSKVETRAFVARIFGIHRINSCIGATLDRRSRIKMVFIHRDRLYFVFRKLKMFFTEEDPVEGPVEGGAIWTN